MESSRNSLRPVLSDRPRLRSSPFDVQTAITRCSARGSSLRRQKTAEGSLSPPPPTQGRDTRTNVFQRLANDATTRRHRAHSPPDRADRSVGKDRSSVGTDRSAETRARSKRTSCNQKTSEPWPGRRSPRQPYGSPSPSRIEKHEPWPQRRSPNASPSPSRIEDTYYPRGPWSPSKEGDKMIDGDERRPRASPKQVKQRRSTSEGAKGDNTLVEIVGYLGDEKTIETVHSCASGDSPLDVSAGQREKTRQSGARRQRCHNCGGASLGPDTEQQERREMQKLTDDNEILRRDNEILRRKVNKLIQDGDRERERCAREQSLERQRFSLERHEEMQRFEEERQGFSLERQLQSAKFRELEKKLYSERKAAAMDKTWIQNAQSRAIELEAMKRSEIEAGDAMLVLRDLSPGEAAKVLQVRQDDAVVKVSELEYTVAILKEENERQAKEYERRIRRMENAMQCQSQGNSPVKQACAAGA